jgi:glutamate-5-semialdehyde dehydrogenase
MQEIIISNLIKVKQASRSLISLEESTVAQVLIDLASELIANTNFLLLENKRDLDLMDMNDPKYDRLLLNEKRLNGIAADLNKVASFSSPLHKVIEKRNVPSGLEISKITVPIGVIGIIYESRPNVTIDVFSLCFKSGNACVLKGSRDAYYSNTALVSIIKKVLIKHQIDENVVYLTPSEREALPIILQADKYIEAIIPRGSQQLIDFVRKNATIPVIETGAGIVHTYFDEFADLEKGIGIIENAKARRVSVCNALDTLIIHQLRLKELPAIVLPLQQKHQLEIFADDRAYDILKDNYQTSLLHKAQEEDFGKEFLSYKMAIKVVDNLEQAIEHIATHGSKHSEAIISENEKNIHDFLKNVDAAVVYSNASTAFTDGGEFGMGAEIGISTQKLHARGPMGLPELTSYKWIVKGNGQIRAN